ncbi:hypothetical protein Tco_1073215 [Tanacetum coccineum]
MKEIKMLDEKEHEWLMERNPNSWCRAYFEMDNCSAAFENGISKSFNSRIIGARGKPIITMFEDFRVYIMQKMFYMNKLAFDDKDSITPSVRRHMEYNKRIQRIPYVHAMAGYMHMKMNLDLGVDEWYSQCKCSNIMPPPPTPSDSNTSADSNTMPSHAASTSTGTKKCKCPLIPKKETGLPKVVLLAAEVVLRVVVGVVQAKEVDFLTLYHSKV